MDRPRGLRRRGAVRLRTVAFRKLSDWDTWWHLAAGRWIATHGAIPATDTLSHTVRDHPWINLQWGFELGLYLLHARGGPPLLCLVGAILFSATVVLLLRTVRIHLGSSFGARSSCCSWSF